MKGVSSNPKIIIVVLVTMLILQLSLVVEAGKIMEKSKKYKEFRCPEGKDGVLCRKSARQESIGVESDKSPLNSGETAVAIHSQRRPSSFARRFQHCMQFAERTVIQLTRELFGFYGLEKHGWEMDIIETILKTLANDMVVIVQAMHL